MAYKPAPKIKKQDPKKFGVSTGKKKPARTGAAHYVRKRNKERRS
jgi:hypothetical protein